MKKQSLIKGSLVLGLAGMVAKVLGFFFRWPLIMLIGDEGIGYYQLSYPFYMFYCFNYTKGIGIQTPQNGYKKFLKKP